MRVLALDTTTRAGSVAVIEDERVLFEERGDPLRSHAERMPGDLIRAIESAGLSWDAVDLFAVASGPGSFTGLRIGIATMQGLAFVRHRQIVPVSALLALACGAAVNLPAGAVVGAWMDAHRREVFSALYRVRAEALFSAGRLEEIEPANVGDPVLTWQRWMAAVPPQAVAGDGAVLYADAIGESARLVEPPLLAGIIGRLAVAGAGAAIDAGAVQPLYVRRPDAEIARDAEHDRHPR